MLPEKMFFITPSLWKYNLYLFYLFCQSFNQLNHYSLNGGKKWDVASILCKSNWRHCKYRIAPGTYFQHLWYGFSQSINEINLNKCLLCYRPPWSMLNILYIDIFDHWRVDCGCFYHQQPHHHGLLIPPLRWLWMVPCFIQE